MANPNIVQTPMNVQTLYSAETAGFGMQKAYFPVVLAGLTGTNKVVDNYQFGCNGKITSLKYVGTVPATTASKAATITPSLGGVNLTAASGNGGALALTTANSGAGAVVSGVAITGGNTFTPTTLFDLTLSSVTAFSEGSGVIEVTYTNEDVRALFAKMGLLFPA